ncbi:MAG TPA: DUF4383 domain-containing protein [Acidobacteriota bacterium]|nr:DUF4383 domain-containing protein [Acidobacteriota bacterium]
MAKTLAWVFGVVFLLIGALGFYQADNMLLGIFMVSKRHNAVHLLSGALALLSAVGGESIARLYFKIFGIVYLLVAIVGFAMDRLPVLGIPLNMADDVLHLVIALVSLYVGFMGSKTTATA